MITKNAKAFWNRISKKPNWLQYILPKRTSDEFEQEGKLQAAAILSLFPLNGGTVIDYGCGIGRITRYMSERATRTVGLDICEAFVKKARLRDTTSEYATSDTFKEENIADFVYCISVMQHNTFTNRKKIMAHIYKILKQGGTCLVSFAHGPVYREGGFIHKFSEKEVIELASGFTKVTLIKSNLVQYGGYTIPDGEMNELILMAAK